MVGAGEEAGDAAGALEAAAQVAPTGVGDLRHVVGVALLEDEVAVMYIVDLVRLQPSTGGPREFFPDSSPHLAIVSEFGLPGAWFGYADQLIFIIVLEEAGAVGAKVPVEIVRKGVGRWEIGDRNIRIHPAVAVFCDSGERVVALQDALVS